MARMTNEKLVGLLKDAGLEVRDHTNIHGSPCLLVARPGTEVTVMIYPTGKIEFHGQPSFVDIIPDTDDPQTAARAIGMG
jgi:hypothetical protein